MTLVNSEIRDNGDGISASKIKLRNTAATGNGVPDGYDLESGVMPKPVGTSTCGRSLNVGTGLGQGVCADD